MTDILTRVLSMVQPERLTRVIVRLIAYTDIILVVVVGIVCTIAERVRDRRERAKHRR